ncbi:YaaA family protein [Ornithinimicrobium pratense]|uniref:Peroxide stress protein YaaA n=1 Tax=Ornithinimicrobium pratense TaxID=2593973 RepID=A0A5J6V4E6_9MICO|nr:peroxide stress protein YaaA [Ornithinimicrobium pratense]QFG68840.1 peroxide stress protein YaaA [Ornithinimicrobium pratense]
MLILLPPSESKAVRDRGAHLRWERLSAPELTDARRAVATALAGASARIDAPFVLGVSVNLAAEIERNTRLESSPTLSARDLYTGVLYDALDLATLDVSASRRASSRLRVVSALYGAVRMTDRVAPYRLSMGVNLPGIGPLSAYWRPHLAPVLQAAAGRGLVVDCRSSTYAAAWSPDGARAERWVQVRVPGATHMAKHTRGLVSRTLCQEASAPRRPEELVELLEPHHQVRLAPRERPGRPWVLDVTP